jgi:thiamine-phosphate pyrophosphorylase
MHYNFKKYYFINKFDTKNINNQDKETVIIYRNYTKNTNDLKLINRLKKFCKKKGLTFLLSNNFKLAIKLNLDGVYIPSFNKQMKHLSYSLNKNFIIIGSAHNIKEIKLKETQGVNRIVISSLFKKNNNYLGIYKFNYLKKLTNKQIIPLGGVSNKNLKKLKLIKSNSFAGISFFEKKKAPKN